MDLTERKSHLLINESFYLDTYKRIKSEFGQSLVKSWTERTDPQKYVFEDCGIASYVLSLKESIPNITINYFADLGCGNGLLVYLLNKSGIKGCGIDARSRKIWDRFREEADLRQDSLDPSKEDGLSAIPFGTDFLIGNHSDELTPWIPVMAARRSCNFFLLPCCPHDFFSKFSSRPANQKHGGNGLGQYAQYLNYVHSVIVKLGYNVKVDRLKISSAKKICFVATVPESGLPTDLEYMITELLNAAALFKPQFVPLKPKMEVKNCTQLPFDFKQALSRKMGEIILEQTTSIKKEGWKCGDKIEIPKLVESLTEEEKRQLKSNCGGLQTFLKNHHQAFEVRQGCVKLRNWTKVYKQFDKKDKWKLSKCWFNSNHPQGCPLKTDECPFKHNEED